MLNCLFIKKTFLLPVNNRVGFKILNPKKLTERNFQQTMVKYILLKWVIPTYPKANAKVQRAFLKKKFFLLFFKNYFHN